VQTSKNKADSIGKTIKEHIPFLDRFQYKECREKNGMNIWSYSMIVSDYRVYFFIAEKSGRWKTKMEVYWKEHSKDLTHGAGKDFELEMGPFNSFESMAKNIDFRTKNNPVFGNHIFHDNYQVNLDKEAIPYLKVLQKRGHELEKLDDPYFDDIKRIYKDVQNLREKSLLSYCKMNNQSDVEKQDFILDLQKLEKLDFYTAMFNMNHF
jgi:hypothetical protein